MAVVVVVRRTVVGLEVEGCVVCEVGERFGSFGRQSSPG
jgi:hypothetical protein